MKDQSWKNKFKGVYLADSDGNEYYPEDFIDSLLQTERQRVEEMLEKVIGKENTTARYDWRTGYNARRNEIIKIIEEWRRE